jgi:ABC-type uncharacterized transport system permease subunit
MNCRAVAGAMIGLAASAVFVAAGTHSALAPMTMQGGDATSRGVEVNLAVAVTAQVGSHGQS